MRYLAHAFMAWSAAAPSVASAAPFPPLINEVLYRPRIVSEKMEAKELSKEIFKQNSEIFDTINATGPPANDLPKDKVQQTPFIELYRNDTSYDLSTCSLWNADGSFHFSLDALTGEVVEMPYFVITWKAEKDKAQKAKGSKTKLKKEGDVLQLRVENFDLGEIDGLALICDGAIVDYLAWGNGTGPVGEIHDWAVSSGQWQNDTFIETLYAAAATTESEPEGEMDVPVIVNSTNATNITNITFDIDDTVRTRAPFLMQRPVLPGDSVGRSAGEVDTDTPEDFASIGGIDATGPTPGERNEDTVLAWMDNCTYTDQNCTVPDVTSLSSMARRRLLKNDVVNHMRQDHIFFKPLKPPKAETKALRASAVAQQKKWVIMTYMDPSDSGLRPYMKKGIRGLSFAGSSSEVCFVLQYGPWRCVISDKGGIFGYIETLLSFRLVSSWKDWRENEAVALSNYINWAKSTHPADRYALHMLGHGNGWKGTFVDDEVMTMTELQEGLDGGNGVDVLYFESCLMAGAEVAYQLQDRAKYVAFSEEVMWTVKNYNVWASIIKLGVKWGWFWKSKDMAILLAFISSRYAIMGGHKTDYTMSVVNLGLAKAMGGLTAAVDKFAVALIADMDQVAVHDDARDNYNVVYRNNALIKAEKFDDQNFRDLSDLAAKVRALVPDFEAKKKAPAVIDALTPGDGKIVVWESHGTARTCSGLHIYHPLGLLDGTWPTAANKNRPDNKPYDWPAPSKNIYALDKDHPILKQFEEEHSKGIEEGFEYTQDIGRKWDDFLIRFYQPTADACARTPPNPKCEKYVEKEVGDKVVISGYGSSDGDPFPTHIFQAFWDTNLMAEQGGDDPVYKYDNAAIVQDCKDDCDRDDIDDEKDDDPNVKFIAWWFTCPKVGNFTFRLMVWDHHVSYLNAWPFFEPNLAHNDGRHWLHFQEDDSYVTVICNATNTTNTSMPSASPSETPSAEPSLEPSPHPSPLPSPMSPSSSPSSDPSSRLPSEMPSANPSAQQPSVTPSAEPSLEPSPHPSPLPSPMSPSSSPSSDPSSRLPSEMPSANPSSQRPSETPSAEPSLEPSPHPSPLPSPMSPSSSPSSDPSSRLPSEMPSANPSSQQPSVTPSAEPSLEPSPLDSSPSATPSSKMPTPSYPSQTPSPNYPSQTPSPNPSSF